MTQRALCLLTGALVLIGGALATAPLAAEDAGSKASPTDSKAVARGEIVALGSMGDQVTSLTLRAAGGEQRFSIDLTTRVKIAGKEAQISQLKPGDPVAITFKQSGNERIALTIEVGAA